MNYVQNAIWSIILIPIAIVVLNVEVGTETVVQTYYTLETLEYEETFVREGVTTTWQLGLPPRITVPQVQYGIKNLDSVEGEFLVSVSFDNGTDRRSENGRVRLSPGQEVTVVLDSPIQGPLSFESDVTPSSKRVQHQREVEVAYKVYEKLWQLKDLRALSRTR